MLAWLPNELVVRVLDYLPISTILNISSLSHEWKSFSEANESILFRQAAAYHSFVSSANTELSQLRTQYSDYSLHGVSTWKEFCKRRTEIRQSWEGYGFSRFVNHPSSGLSVHRIKVDELRGFIITSSILGMLIVSDLHSDQVLWAFEEDHVHPYAHVEYGNGYVVFTTAQQTLEVWRLLSDVSEDEVDDRDPETLPLEEQIAASNKSGSNYDGTKPRGHFIPWTNITPPARTRASRFVYPHLMMTSTQHAHIADVRTGKMIEQIELENDVSLYICYIDFSARHILVCWNDSLKIYARSTGKCVLTVPATQDVYGFWHYTISAQTGKRHPDSVLVEQAVVPACVPHAAQKRQLHHSHAAHFSPCGKHVAYALFNSRVVVIRDFERVVDSSVSLHSASLDIQVGSPQTETMYLTYEHDRIAVATALGVYVIHISDAPESDPEPFLIEQAPLVRIYRVSSLSDPNLLQNISCLQMSDTRLYVNWDVTHEGDTDAQAAEEMYEDSLRETIKLASVWDPAISRVVPRVMLVARKDTTLDLKEELTKHLQVFRTFNL